MINFWNIFSSIFSSKLDYKLIVLFATFNREPVFIFWVFRKGNNLYNLSSSVHNWQNSFEQGVGLLKNVLNFYFFSWPLFIAIFFCTLINMELSFFGLVKDYNYNMMEFHIRKTWRYPRSRKSKNYRQTIQWPSKNGQKDKQRSTKHYTES